MWKENRDGFFRTTWLVSQCLVGTCVIWGILLILPTHKYILFRQSFLNYHQSLFNSIWICVFPSSFFTCPSFFPCFSPLSIYPSILIYIYEICKECVWVKQIFQLFNFFGGHLKFSLNSYYNSNLFSLDQIIYNVVKLLTEFVF